MSAAALALLGALWNWAGGYLVSALGGAAAVLFIWFKQRASSTAEAKKSQPAEKGGEETAQLAKQRLGEAAETIATINNAQRGVNAQSDESLRNGAADRWVRK